MLTIRLSRIGKRKKPMFRLIISEKAKDPYGRALEILGSYNPFTKEIDVKKDRIEHWLSVGAQMSPTVNNLLIQKEIIKGEKVTASKPGKKKEEDKPAEAAKKEAQPTEETAKTTEEVEKPTAEEKPADLSAGEAEEAKKEEKPAESEEKKDK